MAYDIVVEGHAIDANTDWGYVRIGIRDGIIDAISNGVPIEGERHIAVPEGGIIMPGLINTHCHMRDPGYTEAEDFGSYQRVAAAGGITTSFDQSNNPNCPTITLERMEEKRGLSLAKAPHIDIMFWAGVSFEPDVNLPELALMLELPYVTGPKVFFEKSIGGLFQPDRSKRYDQIEQVYDFTARFGKPVANHCESAELNNEMTEGLKGVLDRPSVICEARPAEGEAEEAEKALMYGMMWNVPVVICHASGAETIRVFDRLGYENSMMEFTPHHYTFSMDDMFSAGLKMYPPLRSREDRAAVGERLMKGDRVMIGTDHAPHPAVKKLGNVWEAAAGIPSDEHLGAFVGCLIREGMGSKTAAAVSSYNAARFFGLEDRGLIEEGLRADLVVLDLESGGVVRPPYHTRCGWSPYEDMDFRAKVTHTISNGRLIFEDGKVLV